MKSFFKHHWVFVLGVLALAIQVVVLAAIPERIRWKWHKRTIYELSDFNGASLALGLRNDGVVVWREIMPSTTNSPAEQFEMGTITNMVMTNKLYGDWDLWTNIVQPFPRMRLGTNGFYYYENP